jgi:predicted DNA-binding transcriptional regulator AlpA
MTTTYYAENGRVFARTPKGTREVTTALSSNGRDLERFERALNIARTQRPAAIVQSEPTTELVSIGEIAELTGLAMRTIYAYRQSGKLPAPDFELSVGPVWKRETIEQWNRDRNRKPGPPAELLAEWRESKTGAA